MSFRSNARNLRPSRTTFVGELLAAPEDNVGAGLRARPREAERLPYIPSRTTFVGDDKASLA